MKKILSTIIVAIMLISMVGCTSNTSADTKTTDTAKTGTSAEVKNFTFDTFVDALKKEGLKVEKGDAMAGCIGEKEGYEYKINGTGIGVYIMDLKSKQPVAVNNIKMAKESEKMKLDLQSSPMEVDAIINNNLVIMDYGKHPDKDKIIKIFKDLK
ncbi:hypothetical protein [Clostridium omnivorum]|uniref:Lipoprotein n=1 Tax=Clostridium omnivorum TaxID=1604902 RepID=A0ABQ5N2N4_9CLOT|nr:hypothetical protein [Clostridium sp. E14]GLC29446.1 hypothetical protein bsdE14_08560 [Clostridium sp. E14]